jgi:hypothetical protein
MAAIEAIKLIGTAFKSFNSYVLQPFIAWNKKRKEKKIDTHYEAKAERRKVLAEELKAVKNKPVTPESDAKLEELLRKMHNLGERYDSDD